jgi:hypothetical protein
LDPRPILAPSLSDLSASNPPCLIPHSNAFVIGIIHAFQQDLHLILRPEDMWLAILTQFIFYINGKSEDLRRLFVSHEGKKEPSITTSSAPLSEDRINNSVLKMACFMEEQILVKGLREWVMPDLTTTTGRDRAVASIVMMGTMQRYFD